MSEPAAPSLSLEPPFAPFELHGMRLCNRIVMAPRTRSQAPGGVFGDANVEYHRRRAAGGVGLIVSEGTWK